MRALTSMINIFRILYYWFFPSPAEIFAYNGTDLHSEHAGHSSFQLQMIVCNKKVTRKIFSLRNSPDAFANGGGFRTKRFGILDISDECLAIL